MRLLVSVGCAGGQGFDKVGRCAHEGGEISHRQRLTAGQRNGVHQVVAAVAAQLVHAAALQVIDVPLVARDQHAGLVGAQRTQPGHFLVHLHGAEAALVPAHQFASEAASLGKVAPARHQQFVVRQGQNGLKASGHRAFQQLPVPVAQAGDDGAASPHGIQPPTWRAGNAAQVGLGGAVLLLPGVTVERNHGAVVAHCPGAPGVVAGDGKQGGVFSAGGKALGLRVDHPTAPVVPFVSVKKQHGAHPADGMQCAFALAPDGMKRQARARVHGGPQTALGVGRAIEMQDATLIAHHKHFVCRSPSGPQHIAFASRHFHHPAPGCAVRCAGVAALGQLAEQATPARIGGRVRGRSKRLRHG